MSYDRSRLGIKEDKWVPTICGLCHYMCGVKVHVIDGVAVGVEGIPESSWGSQGGLCGRGAAQLQVLYDPNRVNYPVRRGNPEKGIGIDPKWQRISWEEAMDEIVARLGKIHRENPGKLGVASGVRYSMGSYNFVLLAMFAHTFGANFTSCGSGLYCGMVTHEVAGMNHASWYFVPDHLHCNYTIYFGVKEVGATMLNMLARHRGNAVARGEKIVAFDPLCHVVGGTAKEWIPILPGTDLIVALAMANVLVNELGVYDREHLKKKTDAPYLVQPDGHFVRDDSGEPLVWDLSDKTTKNWKQPIGDAALEGTYEVRGMKCRPVFDIIKQHLKQYSPERASEVSTVPAATIRRIAAEFGQEARIGSTIEVQGVKLPYRPVGVTQFRPGSGHTNAFHQHMAADLLNQLVGACDVPGGALGLGPAIALGHPDTGYPRHGPSVAKDGYMSVDVHPGMGIWPRPEPKLPKNLTLAELFPMMGLPSQPFSFMRGGPELYRKLGIDPDLEALLVSGSNLVNNFGNEVAMEAYLKKVPFTVCLEIYQNETTEGFADIVLPMAGGLETLDFVTHTLGLAIGPYSLLDNAYHLRQPVVPPMFERREVYQFFDELIRRIGLTREWVQALNVNLCEYCGHPGIFDPDETLPWEEVGDRFLKMLFGPERGLDWFKEHGFITWPKRAEEAYWRWFREGRSHLYAEWLIDAREKERAICDPRDIKIDWEQYTPLISWFPPVVQREKDTEHDLYLVTFTDSFHHGSWTHGIPWLAEVSDSTGYLYTILMNTRTAKEKGIKDGDTITLENKQGHRTSGVVHLIEGIHPQCIATSYGTGKWAKGQPIARGKGPNTATLTQIDLEHLCPITMTAEAAITVKVYKEEVAR
ncbi:MAG: molybdopterin-dependent oxidoreductase [Chloroflexi bacterium]|nr:molybdopterin-dependent oxidoreductase [Chloroflexota bacterium]